MTSWNTAKLTLEFYSESVHNKALTLCILYNNKIVRKACSLPDGISTWSYDIELPCRIILLSGGRDDNSTMVDANNNIVKNKHVVIKSIQLDGLPAWPFWLENYIITECDDSDEIVIGSAICVNGRIDINFDEPSVFKWLVKSKHVY